MQTFPCGKCPECIARRISAWSFRLTQQERISENSHFITLTYDTKYLPFSDNGNQTLDKSDIQKFIKRLRKSQPSSSPKLSYYCAAEYGTITHRPHYHIIIFNVSIATIQPAWNRGKIHYGTVTPMSIGYTLKYISKPRVVGKNPTDDRQKEFSLMSKRLGANYLTPQMIKWHQSNLQNKMYLNTTDNKKISMPRYYKDKIYTTEQREQISWHFQQKHNIETQKILQSPDFDKIMHNKKVGLTASYERMYKKSLQSQTL